MAHYSTREYRSMEMFDAFFRFLKGKNNITRSYESMIDSDRDRLPDDAFAIPELRKYPICSPSSVLNGIAGFRFVKKEYRDRVGKAYNDKLVEWNLTAKINENNPFIHYSDRVIIVKSRR